MFKAFHFGSKCTIKTLSNNRITSLITRSALNEALRYLKKNEDYKTQILFEHFNETGDHSVSIVVYSPDLITRAFEYFAISRSTDRQ